MSGSAEEDEMLPGRAIPLEGGCRWLISLDYDGTLRSPTGAPVPESFFELMRSWHRYGVRWGINTGRDIPYLLEELLPCAPFMPDFICTCERYVHQADEEGYLRPARQHNAACREANMILREQFLPVFQSAMARLRRSHPEWQWRVAPSDPLSIEAADSEEMDKIYPRLEELAEGVEQMAIQRAGRYLRFSDARFSKGTALACVAERWSVSPSDMMLMGDGHNDLGAFRMFPSAFCAAPSCAHPDVLDWLRRHGGYISSEPGVREALWHWVGGRSLSRFRRPFEG